MSGRSSRAADTAPAPARAKAGRRSRRLLWLPLLGLPLLGLPLLGLLLACALLNAPARADSSLPAAPLADRPLADPRAEDQARSVMRELRCLVCQSQSIADSNAEMAGDMRSLVRQRIAAGETPAQVKAWFVERYGEWVTFRPPLGSRTLLLWAAPVLLPLGGGWLAFRLLRRPRERRAGRWPERHGRDVAGGGG